MAYTRFNIRIVRHFFLIKHFTVFMKLRRRPPMTGTGPLSLVSFVTVSYIVFVKNNKIKIPKIYPDARFVKVYEIEKVLEFFGCS